MPEANILIAGIGNIFMGDDGFGVEVTKRLRERTWPEGVRVVDFGIRSFDLAFALVEGYDVAILVDALQRGEAPGTLYVFEPDLADLAELSPVNMEGHGLHPAQVLQMANLYGTPPQRILVVGCEPATTGFAEGGQMDLSPAVQASVEEAVRQVEALVQEIRQEQMVKDES
jgi:hydrogenase maturation protease